MIPNVTTKEPSACTNIDDVRNEIDNIDRAIIGLLGKRFDYVKEVVKYKENTASSIEATDRRDAVLKNRRELAEQNGLNPDMVEEMYRNLIQHFIEEEKKIANV